MWLNKPCGMIWDGVFGKFWKLAKPLKDYGIKPRSLVPAETAPNICHHSTQNLSSLWEPMDENLSRLVVGKMVWHRRTLTLAGRAASSPFILKTNRHPPRTRENEAQRDRKLLLLKFDISLIGYWGVMLHDCEGPFLQSSTMCWKLRRTYIVIVLSSN